MIDPVKLPKSAEIGVVGGRQTEFPVAPFPLQGLPTGKSITEMLAASPEPRRPSMAKPHRGPEAVYAPAGAPDDCAHRL